MSSTTTQPQAVSQIDPRGQRFAATITAVLFAVVLIAAPAPWAVVLLGAQVVVFAIGATTGPASTPYAWLFRTFLRPRLGPPSETEDAAPPKFAQAVGLGFAVVALVAYLFDVTLLGSIAAGFALAAAFLNAAFSFCLGCELYLLLKRSTSRTTLTGITESATR
jgi:hypothetical protein